MIFGQKKEISRKWITFRDGEVILSTEEGSKSFSFLQAKLRSIHTTERNYNGEKVIKWEIEIEGDSPEDLYSITLPYSSGTFKSIILSLASCAALSPATLVKFKPYKKGNFTNITLWADEVKLDWITKELPPLEEVQINGRTVRDESKRMEFLSSLVEAINKRVRQPLPTLEK